MKLMIRPKESPLMFNGEDLEREADLYAFGASKLHRLTYTEISTLYKAIRDRRRRLEVSGTTRFGHSRNESRRLRCVLRQLAKSEAIVRTALDTLSLYNLSTPSNDPTLCKLAKQWNDNITTACVVMPPPHQFHELAEALARVVVRLRINRRRGKNARRLSSLFAELLSIANSRKHLSVQS